MQRNRLKRMARERFRVNREALQGLDLVVMARSAAVKASRAELATSLEQHFHRLGSQPSSKEE